MGNTPATDRAFGETVFHAPGEGAAFSLGTIPTVLKTSSRHTDGAYVMHEQDVAARVLIAPHTHTREDHVAYVLEGELGFLVGTEEFVAPTGSCIFRPRGLAHAVWNPTGAPARMLEITSPGSSLERFFDEFGEMSAQGTVQMADVHALGGGYGITYQTELVPYLQKKYGVGTDGGWWGTK
jgi:mannose-6-phosphate isomerase-like protein (cupin superfamily)